jgi:hypothetical protein
MRVTKRTFVESVNIAAVLCLFVGAAAAADLQSGMPTSMGPISLSVRLVAGDYTPLGSGGLSGPRELSGGSDSSSEAQTLVIELTNRTTRPLEDVRVHYAMFKVVVTYDTEYDDRGRHTIYRRTTRESQPSPMVNKTETLSLKPSGRKTVIGKGQLSVSDTRGGTRQVYDRRGRIIDHVPPSTEHLYGYLVEVFYKDELIAEKLHPNNIREELNLKNPRRK